MYTATAATRAFVYRTAVDADAGRANRKDCAAVILYAAETATRLALDAIQVEFFCIACSFSNMFAFCLHHRYFRTLPSCMLSFCSFVDIMKCIRVCPLEEMD